MCPPSPFVRPNRERESTCARHERPQIWARISALINVSDRLTFSASRLNIERARCGAILPRLREPTRRIWRFASLRFPCLREHAWLESFTHSFTRFRCEGEATTPRARTSAAFLRPGRCFKRTRNDCRISPEKLKN